MTNFILISNIGLVAIPEYIEEDDFLKFMFCKWVITNTNHIGW